MIGCVNRYRVIEADAKQLILDSLGHTSLCFVGGPKNNRSKMLDWAGCLLDRCNPLIAFMSLLRCIILYLSSGWGQTLQVCYQFFQLFSIFVIAIIIFIIFLVQFLLFHL